MVVAGPSSSKQQTRQVDSKPARSQTPKEQP